MNANSMFAAILVLSSPARAMADCANDNDCKGDRVCENGACVDPARQPEALTNIPQHAQPPAPQPPKMEGARVRFQGQPGKTYTVTVTTSDITTETVSKADSTTYGARTVTPRTTHTVGADSSAYGARTVSRVGEDYSCITPCELVVPSGRHHVRVEGDASYTQWLAIPQKPSVVTIERRSDGLLATGIVGLSLGIPTIVTGAYMLFGDPGYWEDGGIYRGSGVSIGVAGLVLAAGGSLALAYMGGNSLHIQRADVSESRPAPRFKLVGLGAAPTGHGGGMLGATFSF